ncbi:MAG: hypothetical protein U5P10_16435 [Spirochaetia bacterium]|nr:hypothetical protein [Spirochaetia bacterium]
MANHLEKLVGEWYEYNGYFVKKNVNVGRREKGGYIGELDIVAFSPELNHIVHIEPSLDANTWATREERFSKKFSAGLEYIPKLFIGLDIPDEIEQIALFYVGSNKNHKTIGGGRVMIVSELFEQIIKEISPKKLSSNVYT